jgi:hypothetical protein
LHVSLRLGDANLEDKRSARTPGLFEGLVENRGVVTRKPFCEEWCGYEHRQLLAGISFETGGLEPRRVAVRPYLAFHKVENLVPNRIGGHVSRETTLVFSTRFSTDVEILQ